MKLKQLADLEGKSIDELLESCITDSVNPGICTNEWCDYTTEVEPDQRAGWCEECQENTVKSALVLADIF